MSLPVFLLISSDTALLQQLESLIAQQFHVLFCATPEVAWQTLREQPARALLLDYRQVRGGGHAEGDFLALLAQEFPAVQPVLLMGAIVPEPLERQIACHQIPRGTDLSLLCQTLQEITRPRVPEVAPHTPPAPAQPQPLTLQGLTRRFETRTPRLMQMLTDLEVAARHDVTILLIGETGSGKTYLSKLIHEISPRQNEPFLHVACGALPVDLIESELFGHVRGAFTSAHADKEGKFLAAGRGTILLDEIDVLGPEQQVKLLRVIESGEFEQVGANQTLVSQARLIVASNLELQPLVQQGKFRPDLYYRLNMLKFEVSPLRTRKPDLIPLAERFVQQQSVKHNVRIERIDPSFFNTLYAYPWPGNIRELENVVQRAVIFCRDGVLTAEQLPSHIVLGVAGPTNDPTVSLSGTPSSTANPGNSPALSPQTQAALNRQLALTEREIIEQALFQNNYSRTGTAKSLGISRVTLYNKMKKYGMMK